MHLGLSMNALGIDPHLYNTSINDWVGSACSNFLQWGDVPAAEQYSRQPCELIPYESRLSRTVVGRCPSTDTVIIGRYYRIRKQLAVAA